MHYLTRDAGRIKPIGPNQGNAIHITMDRTNGKTLECYVEYASVQSAKAIAAAHQEAALKGTAHKLGFRPLHLEYVDQAELQRAIFPRAKCIEWDPDTGKPDLRPKTDLWSDGFTGFMTSEEVNGLLRQVLNPQRVC